MKITIANNTGMRRGMVISVLLCLFASLAFGQSVVWEETFTGQTGKGLNPGPATNMTGITKWSISPHGAVPTNGHFMVETNAGSSEEYFEGYRLDGECVWESESIDISTNSPVDLSLQLEETGTMTASDSIGIYYRLDGTDEVQFAENGYFSDDYGSEWLTASQPYISGTNLQIVVRMVTTDAEKKHRIDNVNVSETSIMANSPPEVSVEDGETNRFATVGDPIQFTLTATENLLDAPTDTITLWAPSLPAGATFTTTNGMSPLTQTFFWTPGAPGEETITFYAGDQDGTNTIDVMITTSQLDPGKIWINEIHYDNTGTDTNEGFEIAGPADFNLNSYKVYFYNGNGGVTYSPHVLSLTGTIDNELKGFGALWFNVSDIQNGSPDGIALVKETPTETNVLQFLTYEGSFVATDGPAIGLTGVDIGVQEETDTPIDQTLQLIGRGEGYSEFSWVGPAAQSRGDLNAGQEILKPGMVFILF